MIHATQLYIICIADLTGPEKLNNTGRTTMRRERLIKVSLYPYSSK
jgi:hypothetical protein